MAQRTAVSETERMRRRVASQLRQHPEYISCREYFHAWETVEMEAQGRNHVLRSAGCTRCEAVRVDLIDTQSGIVEKRKYAYPSGYQLKGFGNQPNRKRDIRREFVRMFMEAA